MKRPLRLHEALRPNISMNENSTISFQGPQPVHSFTTPYHKNHVTSSIETTHPTQPAIMKLVVLLLLLSFHNPNPINSRSTGAHANTRAIGETCLSPTVFRHSAWWPFAVVSKLLRLTDTFRNSSDLARLHHRGGIIV